MRLPRRLLLATTAMVAAFGLTQTTAMAGTAQAASPARAQVLIRSADHRISPLTDSRCNYSASNIFQICLEIVGGGLYVDEMEVGLANISGGNNVDLFGAVTGPGGFSLQTSPVSVDTFQGITFTFPINAYLPAGTYSAVLFEWESGTGQWVHIATTSCPIET
jgi:hypothetical protein